MYSGRGISENDAKELININNSELRTLTKAANEITRKFNGLQVDVEQLNNIKKMLVAKIAHFVTNLLFTIHELKDINYPLLKKL